jgi:hypothetical protein
MGAHSGGGLAQEPFDTFQQSLTLILRQPISRQHLIQRGRSGHVLEMPVITTSGLGGPGSLGSALHDEITDSPKGVMSSRQHSRQQVNLHQKSGRAMIS